MMVPIAMELENVAILVAIRFVQGLVEVRMNNSSLIWTIQSDIEIILIIHRVLRIQRVTVFGVSGHRLKSDLDW